MPSLLITYPEAFALGWRGATSRLMDLAHGLVPLGWDISMLSASDWISLDQSAQEAVFPGKVIRTPFTGDYPGWIDRHRRLRRLYRGLWKLRGTRCYHEKLSLGWASRVVQWVQKNGPLAAPDLIWGICTSNTNGIVAGGALADHFRCPLVLEFQDPPSNEASCVYPQLAARIRRVIRESSAVVTTTRSYAQHLVDTYHLDGKPVVPLHLAFAGEVQPVKPGNAKADFTLLHAGSLKTGDGRNARSLVSALHRLATIHPVCRGQIRLRLLGGGEGAEEAYRLAHRYELTGAVECLDEVPAAQAEQAMDEADALVVIKYADPSFDMQIPGKLFQYLPRGKPVLGIMRPSTEAAEILRRAGNGVVAANNDVDGIAEHVFQMWCNRGQLHKICKPDVSYIEQFSRRQMAQRCHDLLMETVQRERRRRAGGAELPPGTADYCPTNRATETAA
jgi:glycosyltransferase involved in cell wall biosynthesis